MKKLSEKETPHTKILWKFWTKNFSNNNSGPNNIDSINSSICGSPFCVGKRDNDKKKTERRNPGCGTARFSPFPSRGEGRGWVEVWGFPEFGSGLSVLGWVLV